MNISRDEQRALHALAQGGRLHVVKDTRKRIETVQCFTRDGFMLPGITAAVFGKLRANKAIVSHAGGPYAITRQGLDLVRAQVDNR